MKREFIPLVVTLTVLFLWIYVGLAPKRSVQITCSTQGILCIAWMAGYQHFVMIPVKRDRVITLVNVATTEPDRIGFWVSEGLLAQTPDELLKGFELSDEIIVGGVRYRRIWYREALAER